MPDFGKTFAGSSSTASTTNKTAVSSAVPASSGTVTQGHARAWLDSAGSTTINAVIYADSAGAPGSLLATSDSATLTSTTTGNQVDFTFSGANQISVGSGTTYWVGISWQDPGTPSVTYGRDTTASGRQESASYLPDPFGTPTALAGPIDVWITYVLPDSGTDNFFAFFGPK